MLKGLEERAVDLTQAASSTDIIFNALRDEIISGRIKAGESIRQEHIANIFNVSRIPVREALKHLEILGLVKHMRHKGCIVSSLSSVELEEIYEIRANLEPLVIEKSVANMSAQTLQEARQYCESFSSEDNPARWGEWNRLFHETLYRDSLRPYHLKVIEGAIDRIDSYLRAQLILTNGMVRARAEHQGIMDACVQGDGELAGKRTREHILGSYHALIEFVENHKID